MANEFELKLTGPRDRLLQAFDGLAGTTNRARVGSVGRPKRLAAVYFDTPDQRLRRRGAALRVRREGRQFVQALKIARGPLDRVEHEAATQGLAPELDLLPATVRPELGALYPEELAPVFATDVERRKRDVRVDDGLGRVSRVELALDEGEISAGERAEPILEVEVELKEGDRALVFDVGQQLVEAGACRILTLPKAARGYHLALGSAPTGVKAAKLSLGRDERVGDAIGRVLDTVFAQWWANHDAAYDGRDPEGVHQLRVAVRRLRSALTLFGGLLAPGRLDWLKEEARWLMGELGPARDLDVFALEMLPPIAATRPNDGALGRLRSAAEDERVDAYARLRTALASERYTLFVLRFAQWLTNRGWYGDADAATHLELGRPLQSYASGVLDRRARAVRKRGRAFDQLDTEQRHEVRKSLKKLRYTAEFFRELYPGKATRRYLARLGALQDAFGHMNDVAAAESVLGRLVRTGDDRLAEAKGIVLGYYAHAGAGMEKELRDDWHAFATAPAFWARS